VSATKSAGSAFGTASVTDLIPVLQDQARALGADAIIIRDAAEYMSPALTGARTIPAASLSAIAIAYVRAAPRTALELAPDERTRATESLSTLEVVAAASPSVVQIFSAPDFSGQ
jgi:hypothetical protein